VGEVVVNDYTDLYNQENYLWNFRYFPVSALFFVPFYLLGFNLGFIVFHIFNLFLNILICILLYKILILTRREDHEQDDKRILLFIGIYLMALPHMLNYVLGQINLYITVLILLSLYIFLKYKEVKWQFIGSLILGISIIIKPIAIFMIPFIILFDYDSEKKILNINFKTSLLKIIGLLLPLSLNLIVFFIYPELIDGFLATNVTGANPADLNFSFSITKLILNFCYFYGIPFNQMIIFLAIVGIIGGLGIVIFIFGKFERDKIIYGYLLGIIIMFLVYFDSWDHHLLILIPILIIIVFNLPRQSEITNKYIKPTLFFVAFIDILCMAIYVLVEQWFPFNFGTTIFLVITLIGIYKLSFLNKENKPQVE